MDVTKSFKIDSYIFLINLLIIKGNNINKGKENKKENESKRCNDIVNFRLNLINSL